MEARLQTLGDFIASELESKLRQQIFEFTAAHSPRKPPASFLSKESSTIPRQAMPGLACHDALFRVAVTMCPGGYC